MKKIISILLVAVMILSLAACGAKDSGNAAADEKVVKIGYIGDLTGSTQWWGKFGQYGAELAVKDINEAGGVTVNGETYTLALYPEDGLGTPDVSVSAYKKLVTETGVAVSIGTNFSSCNIPMAEVSESLHVPILGTAASNPLVTIAENGQLHKYSFRMCFLDDYIGTACATAAYEKLGFRNAAIIQVLDDANSTSVSACIEEQFTALGGKIVANESCNGGDTEFRAQVAKIKDANPDVVFVIINNYAMVANFAKQAREIGIECTFVAHDGWDSDELYNEAGSAIDDCYYISRIGFADPDAYAFGQRVIKEYGLDVGAETECLFGYDAVMWIVEAMQTGGGVDSESIRNGLEQTDVFKGYIGELVMNPETHNPTLACMLFQFKNGERVSIETIAAQ